MGGVHSLTHRALVEGVNRMNDLISRQAALNALDEQIRQCDKALSAFDISMKDAYTVERTNEQHE